MAGYLGSWVISSDLAGRLSAGDANPLVTVAAVAVPREVQGSLRSRLRRSPGQKWKIGKLAGLGTILTHITTGELVVAVLQVNRTTADGIGPCRRRRLCWDLEKATRVRSREFGGNAVLKAVLLLLPISSALALLINRRGGAALGAPARDIDLEIILDSDVEARPEREQITETLEHWARISDLNRHGVAPHVSVRIAREEDEPLLLLLPDYVAGAFHHADGHLSVGCQSRRREGSDRAISWPPRLAAHCDRGKLPDCHIRFGRISRRGARVTPERRPSLTCSAQELHRQSFPSA